MREVDLGWDIEPPSPRGPVLTLVEGGAQTEPHAPNLRTIRAEPGRSDAKRPLPGLPPLPDPRAVLASRILRRATPGSIAAQLARAVVRDASHFAEEDPPVAPPSRRAGALPAPVRQHVAFARLCRHGATWHIAPRRRPSHARIARLGTPQPIDDALAALPDAPPIGPAPATGLALKRTFWQRMLRR